MLSVFVTCFYHNIKAVFEQELLLTDSSAALGVSVLAHVHPQLSV